MASALARFDAVRSIHRVPREQAWAVALASLACLALGILASLDAVTHVERYTEIQVVDDWGEQGTWTYEPLRADGSAGLPMGEPGYFTHDAPLLRTRFEWRLDDPLAERVTALGSLRLVVEREASAGRPAWRHVEELATATHAGGPTDPLVLDALLDLPAIEARVESAPQRRAEDAAWAVVATVRFESAPNTAHRSDGAEYSLPIKVAAPLYVLPHPDDLTQTHDHAQRQASAREEAAGVQALATAPGALLMLALGAAGLAWSAPRLPLDEVDA